MSDSTGVRHTPGPWEISCRPDVTGYPSFFIHGLSGAQKYDMPVLEANARLIAAAPDLLEALVYAREQLEAVVGDCHGEDYNSPLINAALSRATGDA